MTKLKLLTIKKEKIIMIKFESISSKKLIVPMY